MGGNSKSRQKRQQKKSEEKRRREKANRKRARIEKNLAPVKWRLDGILPEGRAYGVKEFRRWQRVEEHQADTERRRKAGESIARGEVVDLTTGKVVLVIEASRSKDDAPDKFAGDPEAAKKGLLSG